MGEAAARTPAPSAWERWLPALVVAVTAIAYVPALTAGFVNWDDQDYATNNPLIQNFSNFSKFFTTPVQGNYHPLTMVSLALNHAISGVDPFSYHLFNLLLHLLNAWLVYRLVWKMTDSNAFVAFAVSWWFALHPMHVESVAWVSERKDVLYTAFFMSGLTQYLDYLDQGSRRQYWICFLLFVASVMSKPAAIIFPAILFLFDFLRKRPFSLKALTDKLPFALVSALFLYLTLTAQTSAGATPTSEFYGWGKRIFFPFYGYMMYLWKLVFPYRLTAFYPLPPINEALSQAYYLSPLVFAATAYASLRTWKRHREIAFGFGFYFLNLFLVLQLFLVGSAIIAERYTYVPYTGLFFIAAWWLDRSMAGRKSLAYRLVLASGVVLAILTFRQARTWENTATLWDNAIRSRPGAKAYTNRAYQHQLDGEFDKAMQHYTKSLQYNVIDAEVYYNMGVISFNQQRDSLALVHYNKALQYRPAYADAFNGRGSVYARMGRSVEAFADFDASLKINPEYALAYKNRASSHFLKNNYDSAIADFKRYVLRNPGDAEAHSNLCVCFMNRGDNEEALRHCDTAIQRDPQFAKAYTNMGAAYINLGQFDQALEKLQTSFGLDSFNEETLKFLSLAYLRSGDTARAYSIFEYAQRARSTQ
ncbi:MAG: tetratricopeptide repeat protein [Saprospiraceae bacterium]|jgi:tetratricopeptide (TPR) repeat protein|nr:tetratricopeptide repeat protein [Saprospiraceae bacterium]MBP9210237.1 tetratricopeptide repeat protein [Saprospiraceae bacterium]MBV6472467.1 Photosystem I assembly protein Ycf3 [Saprospiraceae bacterium]